MKMIIWKKIVRKKKRNTSVKILVVRRESNSLVLPMLSLSTFSHFLEKDNNKQNKSVSHTSYFCFLLSMQMCDVL